MRLYGASAPKKSLVQLTAMVHKQTEGAQQDFMQIRGIQVEKDAPKVKVKQRRADLLGYMKSMRVLQAQGAFNNKEHELAGALRKLREEVNYNLIHQCLSGRGGMGLSKLERRIFAEFRK